MSRPRSETVGIIGAGYVGLVTGTCFAELGYDVVVRDIVPEKVEGLRRGVVPIFEPGLADLIARNRTRLSFTLEMAEVTKNAGLVFVCVDTPPTYSGDADLSRVEAVVRELPSDADVVLVMKSTVPVGTGAKVRAMLDSRGLERVKYVSNPEFLKEGSAVQDFLHPDRVVVGSDDDEALETVAALYRPVEAPVVRTDVATAEMIKYASNAFLATKISFINEIANVCEETGADVTRVAEGMGLDSRIGSAFLNAGIGFGGSCLAGDETVLVRRRDGVRLLQLATLFDELGAEAAQPDAEVLWPQDLEVLSWSEDADAPQFLPVAAATRRSFHKTLLKVRTKMGRSLRCTPDHPFVARIVQGDTQTVLARDLNDAHWLPLSLGVAPAAPHAVDRACLLDAMQPAGLIDADVIVQLPEEALTDLGHAGVRDGIAVLAHARGEATRAHDIVRAGTMRLHELRAIGLPLDGAVVGTARNGTYVPPEFDLDENFWRVVGLYLAEGHCSTDGNRTRICWSFHPYDEPDLVQDVFGFWETLGVRTDVRFGDTTMSVSVSSRLLGAWWTEVLGLARDCYGQRVPDLLWSQPPASKRALLGGAWRGDGSWSKIGGGPSVVLEYGTVSREMADGLLRLLAEFGIVASLKTGRGKKSTCDTYWVRVSGAGQVERLLDLVGESDRTLIQESIDAQVRRIAPTGYRLQDDGTAWVRVRDVSQVQGDGHVFSLEVPGAHTFVTTGGLVTHNCFPKDVNALKQLAGNSGYHFQLLNAVIEVNELQKRRVVGKLQKHLGSLRGKTIALLGLAFKPNTDDMREAASLVLSARLLAEGAHVRGYDPIASETAAESLVGVELVSDPISLARGADALVLVTEWPEFAELHLPSLAAEMRTPLLVDGRNLFSPSVARDAGFVYEGIGRGTESVTASGRPAFERRVRDGA